MPGAQPNGSTCDFELELVQTFPCLPLAYKSSFLNLRQPVMAYLMCIEISPLASNTHNQALSSEFSKFATRIAATSESPASSPLQLANMSQIPAHSPPE